MRFMLRLSIIIPFYNVEAYIAQCLESVFQQDIPEDEYEVICVNDASPDHSREIVLEYQKKHKNLILVEHDVNKKLGAARNTGRSIARGKYIWNVDSDDYIKPNCLRALLEECEQNDLDVLAFNFYHCRNGVEKINAQYPFPNTEVYDGISFLNKYVLGYFYTISPVWLYLIKRDFLSKNNIYSPPINMGEDVPYSYAILLKAEKIKAVTLLCYVYRVNNNSLGGQMANVPSAMKLYELSFVCAKFFYKTYQMVSIHEKQIKQEYYNTLIYILSLFPIYYDKMSLVEQKAFQKMLRKNMLKDIVLWRYMGRKRWMCYIKMLV